MNVHIKLNDLTNRLDCCAGSGQDEQDELQLHDQYRFLEDAAVNYTNVSPCYLEDGTFHANVRWCRG